MARNLCLAAFAFLAISAGMASIASAAEFHSETTNTTLKGEQIGEEVFTFNAGTVKCNSMTETGSVAAKTTSEIDTAPSFSGCTAFGFVSTVIDTNGCTLKWTWVAFTLHLTCPTGKVIHITAFNCWVTLGPQTISGFTIINFGIGVGRFLKMVKKFTGLTYTQVSKSFPGCTSGTFTNGTWQGESALSGSSGGTQVGIWSE